MDWKDLAHTAIYAGAENSEGSIWNRVEGVDVEFIGGFLTAHLSVEKYISDYLSLKYPSLSWNEAKLNFSQKIALLQKEKAEPPYNEIYIRLKDFNSIRNKLSHNLNYKLTEADKSKFIDFFKKVSKGHEHASSIDINDPAYLISFFVQISEAYFASAIAFYHSKNQVLSKR
ncbi:TPA: hypothetical protein ACXIWR_001264 [Enterobacter mori]|uniref:hypothetical protein n=1 Tax=Enterobacter cloacae complex TaxID=354276 RepID=UPI00207554EE|nr:hypothetical protein [Enterobacter cloacae]MCM7137778.1 hypothetical protein [Enterobacter cloacae]